MTREELIEKNKDLFWFTPEIKKLEISDSLLITQIINEGSIAQINEMIEVLGVNKVYQYLKNLSEREKGNIFPEIRHLYLTKLESVTSSNPE
jgi:ERCC4-related helicase